MWAKLVENVSRLRDAFSRRRLDAELEQEIEEHLALLTDEYVQRGLSSREAASAARAQFGSVRRLRDEHWESRGLAFVDALGRDLRFAGRLLMKTRGFSAAAIVTLALAIGVNTTVFSVVNATRLRGLPVPEPERIVSIRFAPDDAGRSSGVSFPDFEDFATSDSFEGVAAFARSSFIVSGGEQAAQQVPGLYISGAGFGVLGTRAAFGRHLAPEDDRPGAPRVAVLGATVWKNRFDADPGAVGRTVRINGAETTIVGVMPEGFAFDFYADLWLPLAQMPNLDRERREARALEVVARLEDGVAAPMARGALRALAGSDNDRLVFVQPFTGTATGDPMLLFLMLAAGFVLLVACANVAGLLFARAAHRWREIAFRVSLGATRIQVARQLLVESALIALAAGALGFLLSLLGVHGFARAIEGIARPYWIHFGLDGRVVFHVVAVTSASVLLFGLAPAVHLAKGSLTAAAAVKRRRLGSLLSVAQLALTLTLLSSAGLMGRSFLAIYEADATVDASRLTTLGLRLPEPAYRSGAERASFFLRLGDALDSLDAVEAHALSSTIPFANAAAREIEIEGRSAPSSPTATIAFLTASPGYFETLGVDLLRGRDFTARDGAPGYENVIVNDALAARYFSDEDPLGKRLRLVDPRSADATGLLTIVGIAPTMRHRRFQPEPTAYLPYLHAPSASVRLIVRAAAGPGADSAIVPAVRETVRKLDPELPIHAVMSGDEIRTQSRWPYRVVGGMLAAFALISLVIAAVGLYAVTAYAVSRRTHELGIRRALGARSRDVTWLVARPVTWQLALGLVLGGIGTLAAGRLLASFLVDTSATDLATLGFVFVTLSMVSVVAGVVPARGAARLDPAAALRHE